MGLAVKLLKHLMQHTVNRSILLAKNRERLENLFEFNLNKTGIETEVSPPNSSDRWSYVAIKELVGSLDLIEESKMKKFAMYIGFTT